ncbi:isoprenoid biosynthesis glyoxalase ElbB [Endozoicomonadaceae bacterium StTr2]
MSKKIAVVLSGCGVFDGAEIHESVLTLLRLDQQGAKYQCFAPDISQHHVVNHITGEEMPEKRNVLIESARIARGEIEPLSKLDAGDFDAIILPGGFGAAKNLCDFAFKGSELTVESSVIQAVQAFIDQQKPVGLACIAPAMTGKLFGNNARCTIGNDPDTASAIEKTGATHIECPVNEIVVDEARKLVTTPAYMLATRISEAAEGLFKMVDKILDLS